MSEDLERLLLAVILVALAGMDYQPPETSDTEARDGAYDHAAGTILSAIQADGWGIEPKGTLKLLRHSLRHGLIASRSKPPRGRDPSELTWYYGGVAASVLVQLARSGWSVEPPAVLRKASFH
jgi:hypothetical protein